MPSSSAFVVATPRRTPENSSFSIARRSIASYPPLYDATLSAKCGAEERKISRVYTSTSSQSFRVLQKARQRRLCCTHSARSCEISTTGDVLAPSFASFSSCFSSSTFSLAPCCSRSLLASAALPRSITVSRLNLRSVFVCFDCPGFSIGFHSKNVFTPRGAPSFVTASMTSRSGCTPSYPIKSRACSSGLATVAELIMNCGDDP
mmetsp:Transcript_3024/g.11595  ORF Transcript_3024/g.11595 Transcript_3024/m.11595 type:complete len:205 (-) Transcript_3024:1823-2437(-)